MGIKRREAGKSPAGNLLLLLRLVSPWRDSASEGPCQWRPEIVPSAVRKGKNPRIGFGLMLGVQLPYRPGSTHACGGVDTSWSTRDLLRVGDERYVGSTIFKVQSRTPLRVKRGHTKFMPEQQA